MSNNETEAKRNLRQRAEEKLKPGMATNPKRLSLDETNRLLHELQVHQIELEMQSEELQRSQAELATSRERYQDLYEFAPVSYLTLSEKGLILQANLTAANQFGVPRGALVQQPLSRFLVVEERNNYYLKHRDLLATAKPLAWDLRMLRADGSSFWAHLLATLGQDADGSAVCRLVITDITERKQGEAYRAMGREALQILNEPGDVQESIQRVLSALKAQSGFDAVGIRLQNGEDFPYYVQEGFSDNFLLTENTLIERAVDGGVCRDKDGHIPLVCTCGLVISGKTDPTNPLFTAGGSCWTNDSSLLLDIPPADDPRLHPRNQCVYHGYASVALVPIRDKNRIVGLIQFNDHRKGRFTLETVEILEGIGAYIGTALMRKKAEDENAVLQAHLSQAQKMEAIGVLAGGIAHDFNNILSVILGYTEMAMEDAPACSGYAKDLDKVLISALRAKDLVKQILAFSRQSSVARMPLKIQLLVKESLKLLRASLPTTITIKEDILPECGGILADPTQVYQIIMNLCTNAFHAMENTGGVLAVGVMPTAVTSPTIVAGQQVPLGKYVKLTISDTGTGIGPDIIGKIFDPYFTTKDVGRGTGMGLSITHGIIKSYGGTITVESTIGQGTSFNVYFPAIQEDIAKVSAESQNAPRGKGRILFVDDEELLAEMGKDMLERLGYTVTAQTRSIEALATFMEDPTQFDLVITDQTMPGLTGVELAKRLLEIRHDLPIILCTGFSQRIDAGLAKAIGIKEFAFKPITMASIAMLVSKLLDSE